MFNQQIHGVVWPDSLQKLTFGRDFNQPIDDVVWPPSLQQLTFGDNFNQPVVNVVWPARVRYSSSIGAPNIRRIRLSGGGVGVL